MKKWAGKKKKVPKYFYLFLAPLKALNARLRATKAFAV